MSKFFVFSFAFASLLFSSICKASLGNHFALYSRNPPPPPPILQKSRLDILERVRGFFVLFFKKRVEEYNQGWGEKNLKVLCVELMNTHFLHQRHYSFKGPLHLNQRWKSGSIVDLMAANQQTLRLTQANNTRWSDPLQIRNDPENLGKFISVEHS